MIIAFPWQRRQQLAAPSKTSPAPHPAFDLMRQYWHSLRDPNGNLPKRSDVDPRGLAHCLDQLFLGDRIGPGLVQLRVSGQQVDACSGLAMTGLPLSMLFTPDARRQLARGLSDLFDMPAEVEFSLSPLGGGDPARLLLLPLRSETGRADMVLGCLAPEAPELPLRPLRYDILTADCRPLPVPAQAEPRAPSPDPRRHLREIAASGPRPPAPSGPRSRAHLRLVHSV